MSENQKKEQPLHVKKPGWLKTRIPTGKVFFDIKKDLRNRKLVTVCEEARCPNIGQCWNTNTATFMILGDTCTRACRFCNVKTGNPDGWLDPREPEQVASSCAGMKLRYVVITMVDRDDLSDGGARHICKVLEAVRQQNPGIITELLAGDFRGLHSPLDRILRKSPEVYAHNLETVERLSPRVRDARAGYRQSLESLSYYRQKAAPHILTKSALMVGLGEKPEEVIRTLQDLRDHGVDLVTLGQYMRPDRKFLAVKEWVHPRQFEEYGERAKEMGFSGVASAPLVRSSYRAREFYESVMP